MIQKAYLVVKELAGSMFISAIVLLSVFLSVFAVGLYRLAGDGLARYVNDRFAASIPPNTIRVSTRQPRSLFLFEVERPAAAGISDRTLRRIERLGSVTEINPVAALRIPIQARVSYLGYNYRSDILAFGVPYRLIAGDLAGARYRKLWNDPAREKVIPVLVPRTILRSFNDGMAGANGLPRVSERGMVGFGFRLLMGKSSIKVLDGHEETDAVVAGFTDQVDALALILPLGLVNSYNGKFIQNSRNEYQYAYVKVKDHPSLMRVSAGIQKMGLVVESEKTVSRQIMKLRDTIALIIRLLQAIIIVIAVIAISFAAMIATFNRIEYYRTLRILGASRIFITATIVIKHALLGLVGAWCGVAVLKYVSGLIAEYFNLAGIMVSVSLPDETFMKLLLYCMLIPVLSVVPALVRLYFKGLSRD
jgi:ABC-type lipoprotein release transport system permease subunit